MKTSRIARETARVARQSLPTDPTSVRQTRSFATSLNAFTANHVSAQASPLDIKEEDQSVSDSSLSSAPSAANFDIEDAVIEASSTRKRKRGLDTPSTTITTTSTVTSTRTSPRKAKNPGGNNVKRVKRQPAKQSINEAGEVEIHPPANWREIYDAVQEMRMRILAPVDTMGCESLAQEHLTPKVSLAPTKIPILPSKNQPRSLSKNPPFSNPKSS